jgi:hypothetical protein
MPVAEKPVASSAALPDVPTLAEATACEEVSPRWTPEEASKSAQIASTRETKLRGLAEHSWGSILASINQPVRPTGPPDQMPGTGLVELPRQFILTGRLAMVRISGQQTVVYLQAEDAEGSPPRRPEMPAGVMMSGAFSPLAAVEFAGRWTAPTIGDYRAGDAVRAVVRRQNWGSPAAMPVPAMGQFGQGPPMWGSPAAMPVPAILSPDALLVLCRRGDREGGRVAKLDRRHAGAGGESVQ